MIAAGRLTTIGIFWPVRLSSAFGVSPVDLVSNVVPIGSAQRDCRPRDERFEQTSVDLLAVGLSFLDFTDDRTNILAYSAKAVCGTLLLDEFFHRFRQ
jgi:hypothetical protein